MTKKNWLIAIVLTIIVSCTSLYAQVEKVKKDVVSAKGTDPLAGLKKAEAGDLDPNDGITLDPSITPIYSENHLLIDEKDLMDMLQSGDYVPQPYIDSKKEIKAFVLRKSTEEEKKQMQQMMNNSQSKSELVGKEAISFVVTDIFGKTFSLEELKGKVIVINFWFVECKPCVMEMPELNELVEKYKGQDVVFLGFSTNKKEKIEAFLKKKTFDYNIIPDSQDIAKLYNVNSFPTHVIIDKNSKISYSTVGLGPNTIEEIENTIDTLIK